MRLIFVRHGETIRNKSKTIQDPVNGGLTREGVMQAKKLAKRLSQERFQAIYCSDSERAKETLKEIIKFFSNVPVFYTEKLREKNPGDFKRLTWDEWRKAEEESKEGFANFKPKNGESIIEIVKRVNFFLEESYKKHKNQNVLWVTHGGVNKSIKHIFEDGLNEPKRKKGYEQDNCCINILEYGCDMPKLRLYNYTDHLKNPEV